MNTRRCLFAAGITWWMATTAALAGDLDRATSPPCSVDGTCLPQRATWGYYQTNWRRWPGTDIERKVEEVQLPAGEGDIGPTQPPGPFVEDRQAPPKVEALEPLPPRTPTEPGELDLPLLPERDEPGVPQEDGTQNGGRPGLEAPPMPPFLEGPPELPFGQPPGGGQPGGLPFGQPPQEPAETPSPATDLFPSNLLPQQRSLRGEDAPPPMPFVRLVDRRPQPAQPAESTSAVRLAAVSLPDAERMTASAIPTHVAPQPPIQPAGHLGDAPPELPALFRRPR